LKVTTITIRFFPRSGLISGFVTRRVPLMEQELLTRVRVAQSLLSHVLLSIYGFWLPVLASSNCFSYNFDPHLHISDYHHYSVRSN